MTISCHELVVRYGALQALDRVTLRANKGECVVLIGSNGCGKSTLLKSLFGMIPISGGEIIVDGLRVIPDPRKMLEQGIAFLHQHTPMANALTIKENFRMWASVVPKELRERRLVHALRGCEVASIPSATIVAHLSTGMLRALALWGLHSILRPRIALLDEPLAGLSSANVNRVLMHLRRYLANGNTVIMSEHRSDLLSAAHPTVYEMSNGALVGKSAHQVVVETPPR